jgi:hypothetical protein
LISSIALPSQEPKAELWTNSAGSPRASTFSSGARSMSKNGPAPELVDQPIHGRLDVLDDVGVVMRLTQLRSKQILRHGLSYR